MASVLVVGAGPAGLVAAAALADGGLAVRIIEKHTARLSFSRAIGINPHTLDLLEPFGLAAPLVAAAHPAQHVVAMSGGRMITKAAMPLATGQHANMLLLPQNDTERLLEAGLETRGVTVERPVRLTGLVPADDGATATLDHDGRTEQVRFDWIVGADGFHSTVRQELAIPFRIEDRPEIWAGSDADAIWPEGSDADVALCFEPDGILLALKLPDGLTRFASTLPRLIENPPGFTLNKVAASTHFQVHFAQCESYGAGRVWLAGDAAHVHSPLGARGMNMSIADAVALAGAIRTGELAGYARERHAAGAQWIALNRKASAIAGSGWPARLVRRALPQAFRLFPALLPLAMKRMTGV